MRAARPLSSVRELDPALLLSRERLHDEGRIVTRPPYALQWRTAFVDQ